MYWIVRHIPLLRVCPPITELSRLRYDWAYEKMRREQPQPYTMTGPYLTTDKHTLTLRNKFDALQEISETFTPNNEDENFVNAHIEAAAECIPTKQRAKPRVPWETLAIRKKARGTWKPHPYAIVGTQLMSTLRNLRSHKMN